jgi:hypothetical protein
MIPTRIAARATALALSLAVGADAQEQRPNFAGQWQLDTAASAVSGGGRGDASGRASGGGGGGGGGIGLGPPAAALTIQQDNAMLTIGAVNGVDTLPIRYRLNGKGIDNKLIVGRGVIAEMTFKSKWKGGQLVTTMSRTIQGRARSTTVRYHELISLMPDGALMVDVSMDGRPGGRKTIYRRVEAPRQ